MQTPKRRHEVRQHFKPARPVIIHHRSLRRHGKLKVEGALVDASANGLGVLVTEPISLATLCEVEVKNKNGQSYRFAGEICYATKALGGIRLGLELDEPSKKPFARFLKTLR